MVGTFLNVAGILIGGLAGLTLRRGFTPQTQQWLKVVLGACTVWIGLRLTWISLGGTFWQIGKQLLIVVLALAIGRLLGRLLRLQKGFNHLGRVAKEKLATAQPDSPNRAGEGFLAATILFCAQPLGLLGALQEGLTQNFQPLLIKAVLDALVTLAFVPTFGGAVMLAAVPTAALQLTLTHVAWRLAPALDSAELLGSVNAVCGLLIFTVALLIFEVKRIEWADYLPALAAAPALTWVWR